LRCPPQNLPFSFFSLQARCPGFLIFTLWLGSCGGVCVPEVTVVAKRFTLVQAAQAAEFSNFILLEAFYPLPQLPRILCSRNAATQR